MATFEGSTREFKKFIGPYLNKAIQYVSRPYKRSSGVCQNCGQEGALDAAHRHGRSRIDIIDIILGSDDPNFRVTVDLEDFLNKFNFEHEPIEKAFLALCKSCHRKYDQKTYQSINSSDVKSLSIAENRSVVRSDDILPISLEPSRPEDFKARLLERREAVIEIFYSDGRIVHRPWIASRFSASSNVFGNLRSRPEFRQGRWQENGVIALKVRVSD